jgi:hypothetical protein
VPAQKAYMADVRSAYLKHLNAAANDRTNTTGTKRYTIQAKSATRWKVKLEDVAHAANLSEFIVEAVMDKDGWITDIRLVDDGSATELAQMIDRGAEFIEHYGTKGMKWGVHKERTTPVAVAPTATSHVPAGKFRKTKVQTSGGENHPAHEDAVKVARAQAKLKKSGTAALSNQELRDLQERLNLERNVIQLASAHSRIGKGRKFVKGLTGIGKELNDTASTGSQTRRSAEQLWRRQLA